jgi:transcription elongation GreA/GreB family factor
MPYLFLEKDAIALRRKLDELEQQKLTVAHDAAVHVDQSAESWHDNAGFEVAIREQMSLAQKTLEIRRMLNKMNIVQLGKRIAKVEVGLEITLKSLEADDTRTFVVSSYQILNRKDDREISYTAPIIQPFIGRKKGAKKTVLTPDGERQYELLDIRPWVVQSS